MMSRYWAILFVLFLSTSKLTSQTPIKKEAPKIGLCLSGGGAKGLAHIGLLKLIDSLGIKVDYITGTSMGSIVGGLYACGYSGKQIDSIIHKVNWDNILSESVPLNEICIDEKDEYNKYIAELAINKKGVKLTGFIEGQSLLNLLTHLTRHVNHIRDFSKLPIPYKCMAVDIETVKPVVLDKGNLALAMRSSMSIPTVFKPVRMNNRLYVDGGVVSNFPVEEVQKMGADIVIGSYTGGRLMKEGEMNLFTKMLVQSTIFYGIQTAQEEIKRCNIFNNLTEKMKEYEAGDFIKSEAIMAKGTQLAYQVLPQLIQLSNQLKEYNALKPKVDLNFEDKSLKIRDVYTDSVSSPKVLKFLKKRIPIKPNSITSTYKIADAIKSMYATRYIQKANYELEQIDGDTTSYDLYVRLQEEEKWRFKSALHYDNELGAGFILNMTARNVLGKASRLFATVDLAQNFKFRVNYRKYLGSSPISFNTQLLSERSLYKFTNAKGKIGEENNNYYSHLTLGLNANLSRNMGWYYGIIGETSNIFPRLESDYYIPEALKSLKSGIIGFQNRLTLNTLDHPFFPKKGVSFFAEHRWNLIAIENLKTQDTSASGLRNVYQVSGIYNKVQANFKALIPVTKKMSILINSNIGITGNAKLATQILNDTIEDKNTDKNIKLFSDFYHIGGIIQRARINAVPFWGLKENGYQRGNFAALQLGVQYELIHNLFITPSVNALYLANNYNKDFFKNIPSMLFKNQYKSDLEDNYIESLYTYSLNIGYRTPLGPILVNVSKASTEEGLRGYLSIGYNF